MSDDTDQIAARGTAVSPPVGVITLRDGRIARLFCRGDYVWYDGSTWRGQVTRVARDGSWVDVWFDQGDMYGWGQRIHPSRLRHA